jgi:hypothetical protein
MDSQSTSMFNKHSQRLAVIGSIQVHKSLIHVIKFSPEGGYLASGDDEGILIVNFDMSC